MLDFFLDNFYTCNELLDAPIRDVEFSVLDFETTGLYPYNGDQIIEIGIVRSNQEKILATYESLINPGMPIPANVSHINHITNDMVKEALSIEHKIDEVMDFLKNSVLVAHNLSFDLSFLNFQLQKMNRDKINLWLVDTLKVAKAGLPNLERYTLGHITKALGINNRGNHRALPDAEATARALQALVEKLPRDSQLKDLQAFKIH